MKAMDNFKVEVTSRGKFDMRRALRLVFEEVHHSKDGRSGIEPKVSGVVAHKVDEETSTMTFYWHLTDSLLEKGVLPLPYEAKGDALLELIWGWLEQAEPKGPKVGGDNGHSTKGWHLVGGNVDNDGWSYACLKVSCVWAWHHK